MRMLIIEPCRYRPADAEHMAGAARGEFVEVAKQDAITLAYLGRALYVSDKDDHTSRAAYTADAALLDAAEKVGRAKTKDSKDK